MIRALAPLAAGSAEPGRRQPRPEEAILYCNVGDVMNLAVARGRSCLFTRVSGIGHGGDRRPPRERARPQPRTRRAVAAPRRPRRPAGARSQGDPETVAAARRALEEGVGQPGRRAAPLARLLPRARERRPGFARRPLRHRQRDPRPRRGDGSPGRPADLRAAPGGARRASTTSRRPAWSCRSAWAWRAEHAPDRPDPAEMRQGARAPMRTGPIPYILLGALVAVLAGVALLVTTGNQISEREDRSRAAEARRRRRQAAGAQRLAPYAQFQTLHEQRLATITSLADSRFDWERVMRELSLVLPARRLADRTQRLGLRRAEGGGSRRRRCAARSPGRRWNSRLRRRAGVGRRLRHRAEGHRRRHPRRRRLLGTPRQGRRRSVLGRRRIRRRERMPDPQVHRQVQHRRRLRRGAGPGHRGRRRRSPGDRDRNRRNDLDRNRIDGRRMRMSSEQPRHRRHARRRRPRVAFWMLLLSPKKEEVSKLDKQVAKQEESLAAAPGGSRSRVWPPRRPSRAPTSSWSCSARRLRPTTTPPRCSCS